MKSPLLCFQKTRSSVLWSRLATACSITLLSSFTLVGQSCFPPPSGLVAWWAGQSNAFDTLGVNNGTLQGASGYGPGEVGTAFTFDPASGTMVVPDSPSLRLTNQLTLEAWINTQRTNSSSPDEVIIAKVGGAAGNNGYTIALSGNSLVGEFNSPGQGWPGYRVTVPVPIVPGTWNHVAFTYDQSAMTLYFNGQPVATNIIGPIVISATSANLHVSGDDNYHAYFAGLIDEASVYNRALSGSEIAAIYNAGSAGKCPTSSPPSIVSQPVNQTVPTGVTASFSVVAEGTAPLAYQWQFNGTNLAGATASFLNLVDVQTNQAGIYSVLVSNAAGSATSSNALLTIINSGCFSAPLGLVDWWRAEGDATDAVGPNNGIIMNGVTFAPGEVGQAFSFNGSNQFITNVVGGLTNITNSFTMEFWAWPNAGRAETPENPEGIVGISGERYAIFPFQLVGAGFSIVGAGVSVGTNGISVFEHADNHLASPLVYDAAISGWTHIAVVYTNHQPLLYVNGVLARTGIPSQYTSCPSTDLGEEGIGYGYYSGLLDEVSIYNRSLTANEIQSIYNAGSSGKCVTPNPPAIVSQPVNQSVLTGATASFSVVAEGIGPLAYQWLLNGTNLAGATASSLTLTNVQTNQAGVYAVLVTNSYGGILSSNAVLTVLPAGSCDPTPAGLVDWWRAEGDATDPVGGNNGILENGVSFAPGKVGQAFSFNGLNQYITNPVAGLTNITDSFTMEFWAWPNAGRAETPESPDGIVGVSGERYAIFPFQLVGAGLSIVGAGVSVGTNGISVFEHADNHLASPLVYD
ncbi:MAG TPA: LamG-like jellyroll fold domain-containing protein, partial [Verrucomicrobiae bacterium]|nr:LamG-like jellyroll fold domain-containing protein [Verrucomicrobiae bacterium]